jgi:hypothetical protein
MLQNTDIADCSYGIHADTRRVPIIVRTRLQVAAARASLVWKCCGDLFRFETHFCHGLFASFHLVWLVCFIRVGQCTNAPAEIYSRIHDLSSQWHASLGTLYFKMFIFFLFSILEYQLISQLPEPAFDHLTNRLCKLRSDYLEDLFQLEGTRTNITFVLLNLFRIFDEMC